MSLLGKWDGFDAEETLKIMQAAIAEEVMEASCHAITFSATMADPHTIDWKRMASPTVIT